MVVLLFYYVKKRKKKVHFYEKSVDFCVEIIKKNVFLPWKCSVI